MPNRPGAIAVFVKTPGVSPVKTRLAAAIGRDRAEAMYRLCLEATRATVSAASNVAPLNAYWAVAEPEGLQDSLWRSFGAISQGPGGLGERLHHVYQSLLERHPFAILIGADAPLLSTDAIAFAAAAMTSPDGPDFAISRASDGGYALFAGRSPLPAKAWLDVPYSSAATADVFLANLRLVGDVVELESFDDIDVQGDLVTLVDNASRRELTPEQTAVVAFAQCLLAASCADG
jgi:glycosyltransferase A (GT-A) superfamily protein (DUF2064 family)